MKRIVICADGTWNTPDQFEGGQRRPTNVTRMALSVAPRDDAGNKQLVFYHKGVGTSRFTRFLGGAFGVGLSGNVKEAYSYLVDAYEPDDLLYFFGFSRGAYTVRSTVGMIRNCGLLRREHVGRLNEAHKLYRRRDPESKPTEIESQLFRRSYSHEIGIHFIGVWDTVGSLGIPLSWFGLLNRGLRFHDVDLSSWVANAFQALAIDERRGPFKPAIWKQQESGRRGGQTLEQRWFAGVHSNVGGGYRNTGLADIAFQWMAENATACGLKLDSSRLDPAVNPQPGGVLRDSRSLFYKFWSDHVRPIGAASDTNETISDSAQERYDRVEQPQYRPRNLKAYFESR